MAKESLNPPGLPTPFGPFAQVTVARPGKLVHVSGMISVDERGEVVGKGDIAAQTRQVMRNLGVALEAAGASFADVMKITNFLTDANMYPEIAPIRNEYLCEPFPASTLIQVERLIWPELLIEIEAVAVVGSE
jgi:2-iminobutanoate/2-iminopropanoate deaminase